MASGNAELSIGVINYNLIKTIWLPLILLLPAHIIILPHCCGPFGAQYLIILPTDNVRMCIIVFFLWE